MKTVYLHVGMGKTGTSYIQSTLSVNRKRLAECGVLYPVLGENKRIRLGGIDSGNGVHLAQSLLPNRFFLSDKRKKEIWRDLDSELGRGFEYVLISSEFLLSLSVEGFLEIQAHAKRFKYACEVIVFARSLLERVYSQWMQRLKRSGGTSDWEEHAIHAQSEMERQLDKLDSIFGRNRMHCFNYDSWKNDLLAPMARLLKWDCVLARPFRVVNRSLAPEEVSRMLYFNRRLEQEQWPNHKRNVLATQLSDAMMELDDKDVNRDIQLSDEAWKSFRTKHEDMLERVNMRYFSDDPIVMSSPHTGIGIMDWPVLPEHEKRILDSIQDGMLKKDQDKTIAEADILGINDVSLLLLMAQTMLAKRNLPLGLAAAKKAYKIKPDHLLVVSTLSACYEAFGGYLEALALVERLMFLDPQQPGHIRQAIRLAGKVPDRKKWRRYWWKFLHKANFLDGYLSWLKAFQRRQMKRIMRKKMDG